MALAAVVLGMIWMQKGCLSRKGQSSHEDTTVVLDPVPLVVFEVVNLKNVVLVLSTDERASPQPENSHEQRQYQGVDGQSERRNMM
jgi:hypothetical protein